VSRRRIPLAALLAPFALAACSFLRSLDGYSDQYGLDAGGAVDACTTCGVEILAHDQPRPHGIAVNATHFFWTNEGDGTVMRCEHGEAAVAIAVTDVGGLVDLNAASPSLLEWLLGRLGVEPDKAATLAAAIVDFRDADDVPGANGAESAAYRAAGLGHGPKNAPFETVTELDQVLGMDLTLLNRLRAVVTVHSRLPGIDPAIVPREILSAAAASSRTDVAAASLTPGAPASADIPSAFRIYSKGRPYRVIVGVQLPSGGRFAREAVIEPDRTAPLGFWVREWTVPAAGMEHVPEPLAGAVQCVLALM